MKKGPILVLALVVLCAWSTAFANTEHLFRLKVFVGYADNFHSSAPANFPSPWMGDPGVTNFIGDPSSWDAGAIRLDNPTLHDITVDSVVVDVGGNIFGTGMGTASCPGAPCDPWGISTGTPLVIPAGGIAILTTTTPGATSNFDTSDVSTQILSCIASKDVVPVINVTVGTTTQTTKTFTDPSQVLNTEGIDPFTCTGANESLPWTRVRTNNAEDD